MLWISFKYSQFSPSSISLYQLSVHRVVFHRSIKERYWICYCCVALLPFVRWITICVNAPNRNDEIYSFWKSIFASEKKSWTKKMEYLDSIQFMYFCEIFLKAIVINFSVWILFKLRNNFTSILKITMYENQLQSQCFYAILRTKTNTKFFWSGYREVAFLWNFTAPSITHKFNFCLFMIELSVHLFRSFVLIYLAIDMFRISQMMNLVCNLHISFADLPPLPFILSIHTKLR